MGYYINTGTTHNKANIIAANAPGHVISAPKSFTEIPVDKGLIVVVDNGPFEAAAFCYNADEFRAFHLAGDYRPKQYVLIDREMAEKLSGYNT